MKEEDTTSDYTFSHHLLLTLHTLTLGRQVRLGNSFVPIQRWLLQTPYDMGLHFGRPKPTRKGTVCT
ncbi:hypothetical protein Hanom_Chr03g00221571 [Helianthus anomalus]